MAGNLLSYPYDQNSARLPTRILYQDPQQVTTSQPRNSSPKSFVPPAYWIPRKTCYRIVNLFDYKLRLGDSVFAGQKTFYAILSEDE